MSITSFKPVNWNPMDLIDLDSMRALSNNQQWLFEHMPRASYRAFGIPRSEGIKIAAGLIHVASSKLHHARADVRFTNFFASGSRPIVTATIVSRDQHRLHLSISGLNTMHPDQRGFMAYIVSDAVHKKNQKIKRGVYVAWHAIGY